MHEELSTFRKRIDHIDMQIIDLLAQRLAVVNAIWSYKKLHDIPAFDGERYHEVMVSRIAYAQERWLSDEYVHDLRERIHKESLVLQK